MENKTTIIFIGTDGKARKSVVPDFKDAANEFLNEFTTKKNAVQFSVAELVHEFVIYEKIGKNWESLKQALEDSQKSVAEMNRFLGRDFKHFKNGWKPYQTDTAYGIVCRAIDHYWSKFYGTPGVDGFLQIVTFYSDELPKFRHVEHD